MAVFELRISASHDDAYKANPEIGPYSYTTETLCWSGLLNPPRSWLSFPATIPPGATIAQATLVLFASAAAAETNAVIRALPWWSDLQTEPSAAQIASKTVTVPASFNYTPLELDVTELVQALVSHAGYTNPGRLCLRINGAAGTPLREIWAWDAQEDAEAVLHVVTAEPHSDVELLDNDEEENPMNLVVLEPLTASGSDQPVEVPRGSRLLIRATTADVEIRHVSGGTAKFTVAAGSTLRLGQSLGQTVYLRATTGTVIELGLT